MEQRHTIKVDTTTLRALRILAAYHGERLHAIVRDLAVNALQHAEQERSGQTPPIQKEEVRRAIETKPTKAQPETRARH